MAKLLGSAAVLFARDVQAAAAHYRDAMGFSFNRFWGEPASFVILRRDGMQFFLKQAEAAHVIPRTVVSPGLWDLYFYVDDVDALHREFVGRGARIDYGPCDQAYGCREFGTQDVDGHDVGFGQDLG